MTKQIERAYRNNRRRSWLLIAAVAAVAAVAIPIASGAPDKTYTLGYAVATQAAPSPRLSESLPCAAQSVELFLTNTAKSASLGAVEITLPGYATSATAFKKVTPSTDEVEVTGLSLRYDTTTDKLVLNNLGLGKYGSVRIVVAVNQTSVSTTPLTTSIPAIVKQSNDFNDTSGGANLFANPTFPTLTVQNCVGTISGKVWNDQDEDGSLDSFERAQAWDVTLYESNGAGGYKSSPRTTTANGTTGVYTFTGVSLGRDYVICETSPSDSWAQKEPTGTPAVCKSNNHEDNGWALTPFAATDLTKHFRNVNSVQILCGTGILTDTQKSITTPQSRYTVQVAGAVCKERPFILEAYAPAGDQRVANFHPVTGGGAKIELIEKLEWRFSGIDQPGVVPATAAQGEDGRTLKYDDTPNPLADPNANPPIPLYDPAPMPYCLRDPRSASNPFALGTTEGAILPGEPGAETSCLIATTERTLTGPTDPNAPYNREDWIYSSVDGYRAFP